MFRALAILLACGAASAAELDILIQGGRVVDGSGAPAFFANVGIKDGRIAWLGRDAPDARVVIDARGLMVAPGFIDVHTHAEEILELPGAHNFLRMGVTSLVMGNCGSSAPDLTELFHQVESTGIAPNIASLIGHNTVRRAAMGGSLDRPPTGDELEQMRLLVRKGMEAGALGLSTGLIYLPGTFARTEEIIELAKVAASRGGIYASHLRDEGVEIDSALFEHFRVAREATIPAHVSHIKLSGKSAWGRAGEVLRQIESARGEGLDITQDQYVYTAASTSLAQLVPAWAREEGKLSERLGDPATKARVLVEMLGRLERRGQEDYAYVVIARCAEDESLNGLSIPEAAGRRRGSASLEHQMELIFELVTAGSPSGVFHGMSEADLREFMRHPNTMFAADSAVRRPRQGVPHPRGYGNNARVLGLYVNELGILRMEEAVRRMTSLPATVFRLHERGQVREGFWADLVIYDPNTIRDKATYSDPHQYPEGIIHVFVNGGAVIQDGAETGQRPGRVLRRQQLSGSPEGNPGAP